MERLKQKVASSSSRVIASLQQAASGTFQPPPTSQENAAALDQTQAPAPAPAPAPTQSQDQNEPQSWLMTSDVTGHLTEAEREILLQVFKKEEQFKRDTIKQMSASRASRQVNQPTLNQDTFQHQQQGPNPADSIIDHRLHQHQMVGTPLSSRAGSSGLNTPQQPQDQHQLTSLDNQRASSRGDGQHHQSPPVGQCRICRKLITTNEPCHVCSSCKQFICEDCASYSASNQHWQCSSCRRRATKPAIPADALRELGLNQNSNAVRRMTADSGRHSSVSDSRQQAATNAPIARHQQQQQTIAKVSSSSSDPPPPSSSSSSSGCSSMSGNSQVAQAQQHLIQRKQSSSSSSYATSSPLGTSASPRGTAIGQPVRRHQLQRQSSSSDAALSKLKAIQKQQRDNNNFDPAPPARNSSGTKTALAHKIVSDSGCETISDSLGSGASGTGGRKQKLTAQKTQSQPVGSAPGHEFTNRFQPRQQVPPTPLSDDLTANQIAQQTRHPQPHQVNPSRRASVAVADHFEARMSPSRAARAVRKQSIAFVTQSSMSHQFPPIFSTNSGCENQLEQTSGGSRRMSLAQHQQQHLQNLYQLQLQRQNNNPQTLITASSEMSMACRQSNQSLADSQSSIHGAMSGAGGQSTPSTTLIPVPPEQMYLRRLSDQSNLVRRSSIIADTLDTLSIARNRSHSNIDTVSYADYLLQNSFVQQQQNYQHQVNQPYYPAAGRSNENLRHSSFGSQQNSLNVYHNQSQASMQRRASDQWVGGAIDPSSMVYGQHQALQHHQQQQHHGHHHLHQNSLQDQPPAMYGSYDAFHQQHMHSGVGAARRQSSAQQLTSIITSYQDKKRSSAEDVRSDSSSELDDEDVHLMYDSMTTNHAHHHSGPIQDGGQSFGGTIPSVSVSEFSGQQTAARAGALINGQSTTSKQIMQINVAIEQAIQQQQQQDSLLPNGSAGGGALMRRGSSGRVLPKIPGEQQSRSLLDLLHNPRSNGTGAGPGHYQGGSGGAPGCSGGAAVASNLSTLDLPGAGQIRRASAPEGQNIKIVVDDMDGSHHRLPGIQNVSRHGQSNSVGGMYGNGGELYERIVLYRDDSLDPGSNMVRGFGLHVIGGKIDPNAGGVLQAIITWVLPDGPADKVGLRAGDTIVEWDGKCLVNMTYEQVAEVIESSANIAELLVRVNSPPSQPGLSDDNTVNYVRSNRRMSQQTELDLKKIQHLQQQSYGTNIQSTGRRSSAIVAAATASNHSSHAGQRTGRRLPQIPPLTVSNGSTMSISAPGAPGPINKTNLDSVHAGSASQLCYGLAGSQHQPHLLTSALDQQLQSRSASELYGGGGGGNNNQVYTNYGLAASGGEQTNYGLQSDLHQSSLLGSPSSLAQRGLIGLQVHVDERVNQLEITVLSAIDVEHNYGQEYIVRIKILPENNRLKPCKTQPSYDLNWNETFIFQNFPTHLVARMALEIGIWHYQEMPRLSTQMEQPICEALISIQSARQRNIDFWPMRPPPSSPQARRKSLNDLLESRQAPGAASQHPTVDHQHRQMATGSGQQQTYNRMVGQQQQQQQESPFHHRGRYVMTTTTTTPDEELQQQQQQNQQFRRERSSSNRNLPYSSESRSQPRRASDGVASSNRLRLDGATSGAASSGARGRRSISAMNVGGNAELGQRSRQNSQGSLHGGQRSRKGSYQNPQQYSGSSSPAASKFGTPTGSVSRATDSTTGVANRRSSMAMMAGCRSQKNSQSDNTDPESPRKSLRNKASAVAGQLPTAGNPEATVSINTYLKSSINSSSNISNATNNNDATQTINQPSKQQHRASVASITTMPGSGYESKQTSRRGSAVDQNADPSCSGERKGSFALIRKLKRTMSLTKSSPDGSRKSSSGSACSFADDELGAAGSKTQLDLGTTRRISAHPDSLGKLKLSIVLRAGELQVDAICAQELEFDAEHALGLYVKMYLKGRHKGNKRKTRIVPPSRAPVFKQIIKYEGSQVDNKLLEVSVWQKNGGLKGKRPLGFTEIRLSELNLANTRTSWYNLKPMELAMVGSSIECE